MQNNKITIEYNEDDNSLVITDTTNNLTGVFITNVSIDNLLSNGLDEGCRILGENILLFIDGTRHLIK